MVADCLRPARARWSNPDNPIPPHELNSRPVRPEIGTDPNLDGPSSHSRKRERHRSVTLLSRAGARQEIGEPDPDRHADVIHRGGDNQGMFSLGNAGGGRQPGAQLGRGIALQPGAKDQDAGRNRRGHILHVGTLMQPASPRHIRRRDRGVIRCANP